MRQDAPFGRKEIIRHLEDMNIETRMLFAGNVLRQPGFAEIDCRIIGELPISDHVMQSTFFVGVYPGLNNKQIDYMLDMFSSFMQAL